MADRSGLSKRLNMLRKQGKTAGKKKGGGKVPPVLNLEDWEKIGSYTYRKDTSYRDPFTAFPLKPFLLQPDKTVSDLVFFDIETTGLSGGAGNIAFLAGFGRRMDSRFVVSQYFLSDFPGEAEFLGKILENIAGTNLFVSYNGKSFDANILNTRFIMNGLRFSFDHHLDLLYPARRLWKSLIGSCSLGNIEYNILKIDRELDVPGFMIPEIYFRFLKTGNNQSLEPVFAHHEQDIVSLAKLLCRMEEIIASPLENIFADKFSLGMMLMESNPDMGTAVLKEAFGKGCARAGRELGLVYKKRGDYSSAVSIWKSMFDKRSIFAGIELAKYYEHKLKKPALALSLVSRMLDYPDRYIERMKDPLVHRKNRLLRKTKGPG